MIAALLAGVSAPAVARGDGNYTTRRDPSEGTTIQDIHKVTTRLRRSWTYIGMQSYNDLACCGLNRQEGDFYLVRFDTFGDKRFDRFLYMYDWPPDAYEFYCALRDRSGELVGRIRWGGDPDFTSLRYCIPHTRRLAIWKVTEFVVTAFDGGIVEDRAPDHGRYRVL